MEWWQEFFLSGAYTTLEHIPLERTEMQADFLCRALDLPPGARILDLACGVGRHSLALARRGHRVVGVDYTPAYLQRAASGAEGLPARFVRGDMRRIPLLEARFDGVINLFTSFGYFGDDSEDERVLREVVRVLKPGGVFLIDLAHHDGVIHVFQPRDCAELPDGRLMFEERRWDARSGRALSTWTYVEGDERRVFTVVTRMYTCPEMERMLREAGMELADVWGDWEGGPLQMESRRLIMLARKA